MQHPDTTLRLVATISRTTRIEKQLPIAFLIVWDMAMPEDNHTGVEKFLACHTCARGRITENMHNADSATANDDLAFNGQDQHHFLPLNIALHSHHRRNRLQLIDDSQN